MDCRTRLRVLITCLPSVQMRTETMHAVAEAGVAAHWLYKVGDTKGDKGHGGPVNPWLAHAHHSMRLADIRSKSLASPAVAS